MFWDQFLNFWKKMFKGMNKIDSEYVLQGVEGFFQG